MNQYANFSIAMYDEYWLSKYGSCAIGQTSYPTLKSIAFNEWKDDKRFKNSDDEYVTCVWHVKLKSPQYSVGWKPFYVTKQEFALN